MRLVLVLIALAACSGKGKPPVATGSGSAAGNVAAIKIPKVTTEATIVITGTTITMNGVPISGKPMVKDLEKAFGKPDRTWESGSSSGGNRVHTWDTIGLLVYEPYDGRCVSATFPYKPMSATFSPKTMFGGSITLDGKKLDGKLPLKSIKMWPGATQPYTGASIVFDRDDFHVFTIEEEPPLGRIDLVELSFWQRGKEDRLPARKPPPARVVVSDEATDCRAGDATRCTHLALALQTGANGRKQPQQAFEMAKLACTGNDAFGCLMLGNMLEHGHGTTVNKIEARTAWKRACTLGYKAACDLK